MAIIPINPNIIDITLEGVPSGLNTPNVNNVALFTNEVPTDGENFGIYVNSLQVAGNYGTNSQTVAMANAVFAQVPNLLSGGGELIIIPLQAAVSAVSGNFETANISANLAAIIAVTNGSLTVTVDTHAYSLTGLNFTGDVTFADVAATIQAAIPDALVTANGSSGIIITSLEVGTASSVACSAGSGGTDLSGSTLLHTATGMATGGTNSSGETIPAAITRTANLVAYCGMMTNILLEDTALISIATAVQALDKLFLHQIASIKQIAGVATTIQTATDTHMRILGYFTGGQAAANLMKAAYVGRAFSVDFTGSLTSQTMNLKSLATINPDSNANQTMYNAANTAGVDLYVSYDGVPGVFSTQGNDFFDNPYSQLQLKFSLEAAGFNYLRQTNTKVPQTEKGMTGLKNAYIQIMNQFVVNGYLAPGQWNSSQTFGDPQLFNNNILNNGYYVYSQPIVQQLQSDRAQRKAPLVQIAGKSAGAIHKSSVIVTIEP